MHDAIETLLMIWERNGAYGLMLTQDLNDAQFVAQPTEAMMNHPAWVLSHLNTYQDILEPIIRGRPFRDPKDAEFGMRSQPVSDADAYPPPPDMRDAFAAGHTAVVHALREEGPAVFDRPVPLDRWKSWLPTMSAVLMNLMGWHETLHLGQLSGWRRALGLPAVSILPLPTDP